MCESVFLSIPPFFPSSLSAYRENHGTERSVESIISIINIDSSLLCANVYDLLSARTISSSNNNKFSNLHGGAVLNWSIFSEISFILLIRVSGERMWKQLNTVPCEKSSQHV